MLAAVAAAVADLPKADPQRQVIQAPDAEDAAKLEAVCQLLREQRLLLLFDDFEQNLTTGGGEFIDPGLAETLSLLCDAAETGRLLMRPCRYPVPGPGDRLVGIELPPLTRSELGRLFVRLPQLRDLAGAAAGHHPHHRRSPRA